MKTFTCIHCGYSEESEKYTPRTFTYSTDVKDYTCMPCYRQHGKPASSVSFDVVYGYKNAVFSEEKVQEYYRSIRHYVIVSKKSKRIIAFSTVKNGDWTDIRDPHVAEGLQDGGDIAEEISLERYREYAMVEYEAVKRRLEQRHDDFDKRKVECFESIAHECATLKGDA